MVVFSADSAAALDEHWAAAGPADGGEGSSGGAYAGWGLMGGGRLRRLLASPAAFAAGVLSDLAALGRGGDGGGGGGAGGLRGGVLPQEMLLRLGR